MRYDLLLKGGHVVDPANGVDGISDVGVLEGKVAAVAPELNDSGARYTIDARDLLVIPGVIDSHVHLARPRAQGCGYRMLVKAGVTTAVDFEGPAEVVVEEIVPYGCGLNVSILEALFSPYNGGGSHRQGVREAVVSSLERGALGVKILGGHYPLSPEVTSEIIQAAAEEEAYAAFHAGTTETGSNILGMEEAFRLAQGRPFHLAHVNAYCRGLVEEPLKELCRAMELLKSAENVVSESHLAPFNACSGFIGKDGLPESHVTRNCLKSKGYPVSREGLKRAILEGAAAVYGRVDEEMKLLFREEAYRYWQEEGTRAGVSFYVNLSLSAFVCAVEKKNEKEFAVDAISSDGGAIPRNFILSQGLKLVSFGAITLAELVLKTSYNPSRMFGFTSKGHLSPGADADIVLVNPQTGEVHLVVIGGQFSFLEGRTVSRPGCLLTTEKGEGVLRARGVPCRAVDLRESSYFQKAALASCRGSTG